MKQGITYIIVKTILLSGLALFGLTCMASNCGIQSDDDNIILEQEVLEVCEIMPEFPGGWAALLEYLQENLVYPEEAAEGNVQGKVIVQFIVDSIGNIGNVKVVRPVNDLLDAEAMRVVKTFPRFTPGRQDGKAVNVRYTLPVNFKLFPKEDETNQEEGVNTPPIYDAKVLKKYFEMPEKMPEFPGGENALMYFLQRNLRYPERAAAKRIEGRVIAQFVVDEEGKVGEIKITRSVNEDLDQEAIRICKMLPDFSPALMHGEPIKVWFTLPITFKLPRDTNQDFLMIE